MTIRNPRAAQRGDRHRQLLGTTKRALCVHWRKVRPGAVTSAPVETWTKDEIIADIVTAELGDIYLCGEPAPGGTFLCSVGYGVSHTTHVYTIKAHEVPKEDQEVTPHE